MMTPERWHTIERLYHEARERDPSERSAFVERACEGDESLRAEVDSLLACRDEAAAFLEVSASAPRATTDPEGEGGVAAGSGRRLPWWVWCWSLPLLVAAAGMYFVVFAAPQPAGWKLKPGKDGSGALAYRVIDVAAGSAADLAAFEIGDLVSIPDVEHYVRGQHAGTAYRFDVVRNRSHRSLTLTVGRKDWSYWTGQDGLSRVAITAASIAHLAFAAILLFARPRDRAARWGALLFAQIGLYMASVACPPRFAPETAFVLRTLPLPLGVPMLLAWSLCTTMPASAFGFCAVFPRPLPMSNRRWWPWWLILVALLATTCIDLDFQWLPVYAGVYRPEVPRFALIGGMPLGVIFVAWALALFVRSYRRIEGLNERRRLRMVATGLAISVSTLAVDIVLMTPLAPIERVRFASYWPFAWVFLLSAAALCTAYAILRHRVFDIHVIVRLGLRYAVARGVLLSIIPVVGVVLALDVLVHRSQPVSAIAAERGFCYGALGAGALALHVRRKTWMDALDRRFFRERYDAYRLLAGVADDVRRSASFDEAARHVIGRIDTALHPQGATLMVRQPGDSAYRAVGSTSEVVPPIPAGARLVNLARLLNRPLENSQSGTGWLVQQLPSGEVDLLRRARVEWLFPVSLRETGTQAFLLLGPKRSEEPYSREDRELLKAVTASLGLLLDRPAPTGFTECATCGACYDSGPAMCAEDNGALIKSPYSRTIAGRYRVDRRLGQGGMGVVYEAADTELKRQVAVKVIRPELMASPDAVARFRREARTAAGLSHPSVVSVYDFGVADDGRAYLVMERLTGCSLRVELQERGRLDPPRALDLLRGVASAIAMAHERGLIHRDLKPENIFLVRSEQGEMAKILDFGLVKPLKAGAMETVAPTLPGALIGTPAYMSPEQQRGEAPAVSWDVWALAVVAFETLTGAHPFAFAPTPGSTPLRLRSGQAPGGRGSQPSLECSTLPPAARDVFERAFAVDCSRRPASARHLMDELDAAL